MFDKICCFLRSKTHATVTAIFQHRKISQNAIRRVFDIKNKLNKKSSSTLTFLHFSITFHFYHFNVHICSFSKFLSLYFKTFTYFIILFPLICFKNLQQKNAQSFMIHENAIWNKHFHFILYHLFMLCYVSSFSFCFTWVIRVKIIRDTKKWEKYRKQLQYNIISLKIV